METNEGALGVNRRVRVAAGSKEAGGAKAQVDKTFSNLLPETGMDSRKGNSDPPICAPNDMALLRAILCIDREVE